jgi:DNA-binding IscR family transcriptional regulator
VRRRSKIHAKILKGVRGPRGGYKLARDRRRITDGEIVRTAMSLSTADPEDPARVRHSTWNKKWRINMR